MEKAYRYRVYPTSEQEQILRRTIGCVRLVFNKALAARTEAWYERQQKVDYVQSSAMLTQWKKLEELEFLNEVSCVKNPKLARAISDAAWGELVRQLEYKESSFQIRDDQF
jgi:transposase